MQINWHEVNWVDYSIIGLMSVSILMGIVRGFVKEALSTVTWVVGIYLGAVYCESVSQHFTSITVLVVRFMIAFVLILLAVLIIGGVITHLISKIIRLTGFGVTDRIIGTFFGFIRGATVIAFAILIMQPSPFAKLAMWQSSDMIPKFQPVSIWMQEKIPEDFLKKLKFFN